MLSVSQSCLTLFDPSAGVTAGTVMVFNYLGDCLRDWLDPEAAK